MAHSPAPKPDVQPRVWSPPPDLGLTGQYQRNQRLADAELWPIPDAGPEDVVVGADGTVYAGTVDSSLIAVSSDGNTIRRITRTGGRPLGIELYGEGRLLVCDAQRGLLAVTIADGVVEELVTEVDGVPLMCTNNAAVADDGTIWFTDSSRKFPLAHYEGDMIEHSGTGRLCRRDPDGTLQTVIDGLHFANGVALDSQGEFVLVAETGAYRIMRHWLRGPRAGTTDEFATMPGFPDNLSVGPGGTIWCAVASSRNKLLDMLLPRAPILRTVVWKLPDAVQPAPAKQALVFGYDREGTLTHNLQSHGGDFIVATGAREHDEVLYVGSLESPYILRYPL